MLEQACGMETPRICSWLTTLRLQAELRCVKTLLVHREVLLAHHELKVINDHMADVVQIHGMVHGVQHVSVETEEESAIEAQ